MNELTRIHAEYNVVNKEENAEKQKIGQNVVLFCFVGVVRLGIFYVSHNQS